MNNFQKVLKNTSYLSLAEVFLKIIGLLWIFYLGNMLSVPLFGRYNFINSFVTIFSFLPELGIGLIVVREIAKNKAIDLTISSTVVVNVLMATVTAILVYFLGVLLGYSKEIVVLLGIAAGTLFLSSLRSAPLYYFEGTENMKINALLSCANTVLLVGGAVIGFTIYESLYGVFGGMMVGTLISLLITYATFFKFYSMPRMVFETSQIWSLISQGIPLALASFSYLIYTRIESILLARYLGEHAVGIYGSATPFVLSTVQLLNLPFAVALYPTLSRLFSEDYARFTRALTKSLLVVALWSFPLSIVVYFLAPYIIPFFFGEKFAQGVPVLQYLIFFVPFASLSTLLFKTLIIFNKQKIYMQISIIGAVISITLNIILIKSIGLMGAVYASVITQIVVCMLFGFVLYTIIKNYKKI